MSCPASIHAPAPLASFFFRLSLCQSSKVYFLNRDLSTAMLCLAKCPSFCPGISAPLVLLLDSLGGVSHLPGRTRGSTAFQRPLHL